MISMDHTCKPPNLLGRLLGTRWSCQDCGRKWVSVHAINPDGRTSIRGEWAVIEE